MSQQHRQQNSYSNPAFCQQSEYYNKNPRNGLSPRQSPLGAQAPARVFDLPPKPGPKPLKYSNNNDNYEEQDFYEELLVDDTGVIQQKNIVVVSANTNNRYATLSPQQKHRYEYIPMQTSPKKRNEYELIGNEKVRYAVVPIPVQHSSPVPRYEYIDEIQKVPPNPYATQKLHELLTTPKKPKHTDPFVTPPPRKVQQKLNYTLSTRQTPRDKMHTAIVAPTCSSPVQSIYSETTFSNKSESWMNVNGNKQPVNTSLTIAAVMMLLCGGLTSSLCFYMVSFMGRLYFLDFGIVSGFACLVLGLLGFRSRNHYYWLPNRNYMSGYIILTVFSLLTCVGLLVLLFMQPKPGSPLADMTSGAVCGISVLSLILATVGVVSSYCCKLPPPDNRVEHCARGFTV